MNQPSARPDQNRDVQSPTTPQEDAPGADTISSSQVRPSPSTMSSWNVPATFRTTTPPPDVSANSIEPGMQLGQYLIEAKLGQGGMGAVYKARHRRLNKTVALKVLAKELVRDPSVVARFDREVKLIASLEHPQIVRAMDAGEAEGFHYLVMEFVDGVDLHQAVRLNGPCEIVDACEIIRQAALGLSYAHERGLVHRDIKPGNLFLARDGHVKILDLGLARLRFDSSEHSAAEFTLTSVGSFMGTPDYMAPEQWEDSHGVDHRCDLYALGCTLYFLLTGKAPFDDSEHNSLMLKLKGHTLEVPPRLRSLRNDVPVELDELAQRLLAKSPADRPQSAKEVAAILGRIAETQAGYGQGQTLLIPHGGSALSLSNDVVEGTSRLSQLIDKAELASKRVVEEPLTARLRKRFPLVQSWPVLFGMLLMAACFVIGGIWGTVRTKVATTGANSGSSERQVAANGDDRDGRGVSRTEQGSGARASQTRPVASASSSVRLPAEIINKIGMRLVYLPPGEFRMGSSDEDLNRVLEIDPDLKREWFDDEQPQRLVSISNGFYLSESEVTQQQWKHVMETEPWVELNNVQIGPDYPAVGITWHEAIEFCRKLSAWERREYRLPTEAEWEYACRAGTDTLYSFGNDHRLLSQHAWWGGLSLSGGSVQDRNHAHQVARKTPNPFGLHDMHGNVFEWCSDWYSENAYQTEKETDPAGPAEGQFRVFRGGAWDCSDLECRSADRHRSDPSHRAPNVGFRVVMTAPKR